MVVGEHQVAFVNTQIGSDTPDWRRLVNHRYSEQRIVAGDPLYALGDFTTHGGVDPSIDRPGEIAALLRIWKKDRKQLLQRFDENKDGEIDLKEWEQAGQAAEIAVEESDK